jgi:hypothetical protein
VGKGVGIRSTMLAIVFKSIARLVGLAAGWYRLLRGPMPTFLLVRRFFREI